MKTFIKKKLNDKGLTLVELLAVIVILGVIAAIAVPAIGNIITNSKVSALKADGQNAISAANIYFAETSEGSVTIEKLSEEGYMEDVGGLDVAGTVARVDTSGVSTIEITAEATNGNISVEFTSATNADINAADNKTGGDNVAVKR